MALVHFLNVNKSVGGFNVPTLANQDSGHDEGQCSIIQHDSGRVTVIDICNGWHRCSEPRFARLGSSHNPAVNPLDYLNALRIRSIHRFVLTHPHLDHLDGIQFLLQSCTPKYFWDTAEKGPDPKFWKFGPYRESDWTFYLAFRGTQIPAGPIRLIATVDDLRTMAPQECDAMKEDGLTFLAQSAVPLAPIGSRRELNESSQVVLFRAGGKKVLFAGDLPSDAWAGLVAKYPEELSNLDILVAPHHGERADFPLDLFRVARPAVTVLGNCLRAQRTISLLQEHECFWVPSNVVGSWVFDTSLPHVRLTALGRRSLRSGLEQLNWISCPMRDGSPPVTYSHNAQRLGRSPSR